mmetsp:Transcript_28410/g.57306  ORF Transcript_28410/g.57306 Transcript_28410/m.57306 type:complete len:268 (+) Transcript_28410:966-1769(+)
MCPPLRPPRPRLATRQSGSPDRRQGRCTGPYWCSHPYTPAPAQCPPAASSPRAHRPQAHLPPTGPSPPVRARLMRWQEALRSCRWSRQWPHMTACASRRPQSSPRMRPGRPSSAERRMCIGRPTTTSKTAAATVATCRGAAPHWLLPPGWGPEARGPPVPNPRRQRCLGRPGCISRWSRSPLSRVALRAPAAHSAQGPPSRTAAAPFVPECHGRSGSAGGGQARSSWRPRWILLRCPPLGRAPYPSEGRARRRVSGGVAAAVQTLSG